MLSTRSLTLPKPDIDFYVTNARMLMKNHRRIFGSLLGPTMMNEWKFVKNIISLDSINHAFHARCDESR